MRCCFATLTLLGQHFRLTPIDGRGSAPAEKFLVDDGPHTVGIIGSVTRPFCGGCNRVRLTADGQIRNCLFAREESDLRFAMRAGASDAELAERRLTATAAALLWCWICRVLERTGLLPEPASGEEDS